MKTQQSDWLMAFLLRGKSVLFIQDFLYCFPREHCISSKTVISWHLTRFSKNSFLVRRSQHLSTVKFCRYDKAVSCKGQLAKARDRKTRLWNSLPENATIASQISASILSLPSKNFSIKKKKGSSLFCAHSHSSHQTSERLPSSSCYRFNSRWSRQCISELIQEAFT